MRKSYLFIIFYFLCVEVPAATTPTDQDCYTRCGNWWAAVYDLLLGEEPAPELARGYAPGSEAAAVAATALGARRTMSSLYSDVAVPALSHGTPGAEEMPAKAAAGSAVGFRPDHLPSTGGSKARASTLPTVASAGPGALVFNKASAAGSLAGEPKAAPVPDTGRMAGSLTMGDLAAASGFSAASGGTAGSILPYPGVQAHSSDGDIPTTAPGLPGTASDEPPATGAGK